MTASTGNGKSTTSKKQASGKKTVRVTKQEELTRQIEQQKKDKLVKEIIFLVVLVFAVLVFLGYFGVIGAFGNATSYFFFGLFGALAYVFPIVVILLAVILTFFDVSTAVKVRIFLAFLAYIFVCTFAQLIHDTSLGIKVTQYFTVSATDRVGGGFFGGAIALLLLKIFGKVGAYIVDILLILIMIIVITGRSIISAIKNGGEKVVDVTKHGVSDYRKSLDEEAEKREIRRTEKEEERQRRFEERELRRKKNQVDLNNVIPDEDEINHELTPDSMKKNETEVYTFTGSTESNIITINSGRTQTTIPEKDPVVHQNGSEYAHTNGPEYEHQSYEQQITDHSQAGMKEVQPDPNDVIFGGVAKDRTSRRVNDRETYEQLRRSTYDYEILDGDDYKKPVITPDRDILTDDGAIDTSLIAEEFEKEELARYQATESYEPDPLQTASAAPSGRTAPKKRKKKYVFPKLELLNRNSNAVVNNGDELKSTAGRLQQTLASFGINVTITDVISGPTVTRYEFQPAVGVKVSTITSLTDDIKMALAAESIRIEAPVPGKSVCGIEVPNKTSSSVFFGDLIASKEFKNSRSKLSAAIGVNISGEKVIADLAKMPHVLVAGQTGSGKSVCTNSMIMSVLYKATPDEVKMILVDPKMVEFKVYNGIPHLLTPVITDPKKATEALNWAVAEMTRRYNEFSKYGVRNMEGFNDMVDRMASEGAFDGDDAEVLEKMPQILIVIDELADLMMTAKKDVEDAIVRLTQLARAAGMHLVIATQRPSVNVVTGLIKANVPSRIALSLPSQVDSKTILDRAGAEKLLSKGDMLYFPTGTPQPERVQGCFVSDKEVADVVKFIIDNNSEAEYNNEIEQRMTNPGAPVSEAFGDRDDFFPDAGRFIIEKGRASTSMLQRVFKIGFNRAARIMDQLGDAGVVGPEEGNKPRRILMTMEEFESFLRDDQ